jgi:hypothetical protein
MSPSCASDHHYSESIWYSYNIFPTIGDRKITFNCSAIAIPPEKSPIRIHGNLIKDKTGDQTKESENFLAVLWETFPGGQPLFLCGSRCMSIFRVRIVAGELLTSSMVSFFG